MKIKIRQKQIISFFALAIFFAVPFLVFGQLNPTEGMDTTGLTNRDVYDILLTIMKWLLMIITVVAVIGFIISGLMFIIGGGSGKMETAKNWLLYSIIGIVVSLLGYIAVNLIVKLING